MIVVEITWYNGRKREGGMDKESDGRVKAFSGFSRMNKKLVYEMNEEKEG